MSFESDSEYVWLLLIQTTVSYNLNLQPKTVRLMDRVKGCLNGSTSGCLEKLICIIWHEVGERMGKLGVLLLRLARMGARIFDFLNKCYKETQTLANRRKMSVNLVAGSIE